MPGDFRQKYRYDRTVSPGDAEQAFVAVDGAGNEVVIKLVAARDPDRFLQQMQAAGGIAHPDVARIFDWGMDNDRCYVVTEHVQGTRLESLLTAGPLQYPAVADAGEQVAAALSAIHAHGLVHGGVAPSTITRTPNGTMKLQDLGLRLATGPRAPDRTGAGAAYISPEEAAGYEPTQASDQYSLGAVLYELVAGRPPLAASPAVNAADPAPAAPPPLRALAPDVPYRLENVIGRAMAWRPQERFGSIEEMRQELERARLEMQAAAAPRVSETAVTTMIGHDVSPDEAAPGRSWLWAWILGGVVLLVAVGLLIAWALGAFSSGGVSTPDLVGQSLSNAKATLSNAGLKLGTVQYQTGTNAQTQGLAVTKQDPVAGTSVDDGSAVNVTLGTGTATVPSVVGMTQTEASAALQKEGLSIASVNAATSSTVAKGKVISQNPQAGAKVPKGSQVLLTVSSGTGSAPVPDVVGQTQASAANALQAAGFTVAATQQSSSSVQKGNVISQKPAAGTSAKKGSTVTITVSTGAASASVPDVAGQTQSAATTTLQNAGFTVSVTQQASATVPSGSVISQNPSAGVQATQGSTVTIVVSSGPTTPTASPSP